MANNLSFDKYLEKEIKKDLELKTRLGKISKALDIAYQIYDLRKEKGLTQTQFAKMIGVSQPNIARIEKADYRNYTIKTLEKVAQALNTTVQIYFSPIDTFTNFWIVPRSMIKARSGISISFEAEPSKAVTKQEYNYNYL